MQRRLFRVLHSIMAPKPSKTAKKEINTGTKEEIGFLSVLKSGDYSLKILAKPGSKETGIVGVTDEGVELKIAAQPVEGAANTELIEYLSKLLGIRKGDLSLDRGSKSRVKTINISKDCKLSFDQVKETINSNVGK